MAPTPDDAPPQAPLRPEHAFADAARRGDRAGLVRLLGALAAVPEEAVLRAAKLRSAKGLVALCWKAGLTPRCALVAQTVLAGIAPALALAPAPEGGWLLDEAEMGWQLRVLAEPPGGGAPAVSAAARAA